MRKKASRIPYAVAALAAGLVVLLAWVNRDRLSPVIPGRDAPNFSAFDLDGTPKTLDDFGEKVLLVNIWATWCPPCREEMPSMQRLYQEIGDDGFEILAISVDAPFGESDAFGRVGGDLATYADSLGLSFTILHDPSGRIQQTFQTTGVPESFLIDRDGVIYKKVAGAMAWDATQNVELIRRLLGG
jgi:cytochrome c biogenesis protein CcmG/thiol:disulfide interchange protein DsbE